MSFSSEVKAELCRTALSRRCCAQAEAYGVLLYCNQFTASQVRISTESNAFAARLPALFHRAFQLSFDRTPEEGAAKRIFSITEPDKLSALWSAFGHEPAGTLAHHINFAVLEEEHCRLAFFRGAFLAGGSVTDPEKEYHLEFVLEDEAFAAALQRLIARFSLSAHLTKRRAMALVYLKGQSEITDMLSIFGAQSARFAMEDAYIRKELRNNANRAVNCDSANVQRAVTAASRQTEAIERVLAAKGRESLPPALRETAALRLAHPEMSLEELGRLCDPPVGKSGVNHRLRKLEIMARELDGQETAENAGGGKADGADD